MMINVCIFYMKRSINMSITLKISDLVILFYLFHHPFAVHCVCVVPKHKVRTKMPPFGGKKGKIYPCNFDLVRRGMFSRLN